MTKIAEIFQTHKEETLVVPDGEITLYRTIHEAFGDLHFDPAKVACIRPYLDETGWLMDEDPDPFDRDRCRLRFIGGATALVNSSPSEILQLCNPASFICLPAVSLVSLEKTGWDAEGEFVGSILHASIAYGIWVRKSAIVAVGPLVENTQDRLRHIDKDRCLVYVDDSDDGWIIDLPQQEAVARVSANS